MWPGSLAAAILAVSASLTSCQAIDLAQHGLAATSPTIHASPPQPKNQQTIPIKRHHLAPQITDACTLLQQKIDIGPYTGTQRVWVNDNNCYTSPWFGGDHQVAI